MAIAVCAVLAGEKSEIRDGKVADRPIYMALAVTVEGTGDILGLWAGDGGQGAKFWLQVTEPRNRGVADVCMVVATDSKGLPHAITATWPLAVTQTRVVHLLRNSLRYAGRQHWDPIAKGAAAGLHRTDPRPPPKTGSAEFNQVWGSKYPAIIRPWDTAWAQFVPLLAFDTEIRTAVYSTNAIESLNACIRRAVRARGHLPNKTAALKRVYPAIISLDPTGQGRRH